MLGNKRILLAAVILTACLVNGCFTVLDEEGGIDPFNNHNAKLVDKMFEDMHEAHQDFDYIVWGLDSEED